MKKLAIIALAVTVGAVANADVYNNGAVTDGTNSTGAAISRLVSPQSSFGLGMQVAANNSVADDFVVTGAGWKVTAISFYSYQTNASSTNFTFTGANVSIVSGGDPNAGSSEFSVSNAAVSNGGFVGYRVASTTPDVTNRPIFKVTISVPNVVLGAGTHSLRWNLNGSLASGPWQPPVVPFTYTNGTGSQSLNGGSYAAAIDTGINQRMEFPFQIEYTAVPEPASMMALAAGIAAVAARRRRK